ncbi:mCG147402 [Mus musculus]|nr:mCG147402 [Mus musculus]
MWPMEPDPASMGAWFSLELAGLSQQPLPRPLVQSLLPLGALATSSAPLASTHGGETHSSLVQ